MTRDELVQRFEAARAAKLAGTERAAILPPPASDDYPGGLRLAREHLGLTQDQLSKEAGLDGNQPGRHERGLSRPRDETWRAEDDALFRVYIGQPRHIRRLPRFAPIAEPSPASEAQTAAEPVPTENAGGPLLSDATLEQIIAECKSRGAVVTLQFA